MIIPSATIIVKDPTNDSTSFVNGHNVTIRINASPVVDGFLVSESITTQPSASDPRFVSNPPTSIVLQAETNTTAVIFLWIRTVTDEVNPDPITASIHVLPEEPSATVTLTGIIDSNGILVRNKASVEVVATDGIKGYAISESLTIQPNIFSSSIPATIAISPNESFHTIYTWLQDNNNKINSAPFISHFFGPLDNILAHRPYLVFVDDQQQGVTSQTRNLRAVTKYGDYVQWNGIKFNPVGKNFSKFRLDRKNNGYLISTGHGTDEELLASSNFWDSIDIKLQNRMTSDITICQDKKVVYSNRKILLYNTIESIDVTNDYVSFRPYNLMEDYRVLDFVSDENNEITLEIDEYDFSFLDHILKHNPSLQTNYGALTDVKQNEAPPLSEPITLAIRPVNNEATFLTQFLQSEIEFTYKELKRLQEFGIPITDYILELDEINNTIPVTTRINIDETGLVISDSVTNDNTPFFDINVINSTNTAAEFSIQISQTKNFTSPTTIALRVLQNDSRFTTITSPPMQDVKFLDGSFPYGTIYWRVRRNQSDWTQPASITVRSAPVVQLQFTIDSQFVKKIGTIANVKVLALDGLSNPVEGAKIDFAVTAGTNIDSSNADITGVAQTTVNMPRTKQNFLISALSESHIITHTMSATDTPHLESEISFDRNDDAPPVARYIIYRKAYAEVRDENNDQILMISQTPSSPIIRRDTTELQPGVLFDPQGNDLAMAKDLLPPRRVDRQHPIAVTNYDCDMIVSWHQAKERGTTWHYNGKSTSNTNAKSEDFAIKTPGGHKFDVISTGIANNETISPSPYSSHGETFSAYTVQRIDATLAKPFELKTPTSDDTGVLDTNGLKRFDFAADTIANLTSIISGNSVLIQWTNPTIAHIHPGDFVYRVLANDIAGNSSFSKIQKPPQTITQCVRGTLLTRINSTECFSEDRIVDALDSEIPLTHGSVLSKSVIVKKLPECYILRPGLDYSIISAGNENTGTRGMILFHQTGILDYDDKILIGYRYGKAINCGTLPDRHDFIIHPFNGAFFSGNAANAIAHDPIVVSEPVAYTYGVWTISLSGNISEGAYAQVLLDL